MQKEMQICLDRQWHRLQEHVNPNMTHTINRLTAVCLTSLLAVCGIRAQQQEILAENIRTLQVVADDRWTSLPVIDLNGEERVNISFDEMSHAYRRFSYRIAHCDADWRESDVFETDYIDGFTNNLTVSSDEQSLNMATLYTHYTLQIPNDECRLKMSGNYRVTITDDESGKDVARACFMVTERKMGVAMTMTTNTDIDYNRAHQQIALSIAYSGVNVTDPDRQLSVITMQNNRWSTARKGIRPTTRRGDGLEWKHCRQLIFPATNEYRKFEYLDLHRNSLGVEHTDFDGQDYHVWLYTDTPRTHYSYDEDADGAFYIRNTDNVSNNTETEYFVCHFTYRCEMPFDGDVYVNGQWTYDSLLPEYRMEYDPLQKLYHCAVTLKMGYYSYQYVMRKHDGTTVTLPADGNFSETQNTYSCLVYYRPIGGRADLLYGYATIE